MKTAEEILELILSIHRNSEDFVEGDIEERIFKSSFYELTTVCPQLIEQEWSIDDDIVDKYCNLDPKTCPPIVILKYSDDNYSLIDGSHRVESFKKLGITTIPAYIGKVKF